MWRLLGLIGVWSIVTGAVYQAALEFDADEEAANAMNAVRGRVVTVPPISRWWLAVPPAYFALRWRRSVRNRDALLRELDPEELAVLTRFLDMARGWSFVALGSILVAVREAHEAVRSWGWPGWTTIVVAPGLGALALWVAASRRTPRAGGRRARR